MAGVVVWIAHAVLSGFLLSVAAPQQQAEEELKRVDRRVPAWRFVVGWIAVVVAVDLCRRLVAASPSTLVALLCLGLRRSGQ